MEISFRKAVAADVDLYFRWVNDEEVRKHSYQADPVSYENHVKWFNKRLDSPSTFFYLFQDEKNTPVGQVRIERMENETIIGISIDQNFRGKGFGSEMLIQASNDFLSTHPADKIHAYIKITNPASLRIFEKAGFKNLGTQVVSGCESYKLIKTKS